MSPSCPRHTTPCNRARGAGYVPIVVGARSNDSAKRRRSDDSGMPGPSRLNPTQARSSPWQCRCQSCGRTVTPLLNNVSRGKGPCRWCGRLKQAAAKRIDPKLVEAALRVAGAEPVEPYPGRIDHPWRCQCTRCNRSIAPRPGVVMARGSDPCPYCSRVRMDPEEAVETMREAGVEPLDVYPGARHPWRCRCLRCGREVTPWFSSVRDGQGGCGFCVKNKLDPAEATERMRAAGIIPDGPYPGRRDRPWPGHCIRCGSPVHASLSTALDARGAGGCPACANRARREAQRIPPEVAVERMRAAGAEPLEPYRDGGTPWRCQCLRCGGEVTPRLWLIGQGVGPCPTCSVYGFDRTGPAIVYLVTHPVLRAHKVGIAGVASTRLRHHRANG